MSTLTEMRANLGRVRKLLGRKSWEFETLSNGSFRQLERDHPLYCKLFSYRENCIVISPRMTAKCKSNGVTLAIECDIGFGDVRIVAPDGLDFEGINPEAAVKKIEAYMSCGDPNND
ncbi:hypothetical protein VCR15J2_390083 [Vibrio coralliirubri]|uniref:hypothetical protein n=1 Tax=Vibrio coralliirubri TaxID=1516159 RepID=UPI0006328E6E|nr:hypothetical protein [Vibrio coralliirubri]CDT53526.1 hypothetical protein VCR15J2_390083 [Vibrio coralliirubri]